MKRITCIALLITMVLAVFSFRPLSAQAADASISASSAEIKSLFFSRSNGVHPRLYGTKDHFTELRQRIHADPYSEKWYTNTYQYYGEQHLTDTLIWVRSAAEQASSGKRFNDLFDGIGRIANTAFLYQLTGETRFAECALKDMLWLAGQSTWSYNFLEMAQISYALGLGYDWLYDYMTAAQRKTICDAIYYKAIEASYTLPSDQIYWKTINNNLNSWVYGGLTIGALAIFESYPDRCAEFLSEMVTNIQNSMSIYAPCGSYPEGPDYSVSGLSFTVYTLEACLSVLGTEFGLSKINGFRESGEYLPAINGYTASFNYGDGGVYIHNTAALFWYANHFQKPELALWQRNVQTHDAYTHDAFFALLWYKPDMLMNYGAAQAQKDYLLRDDLNYQSVATFRSDSDSVQQIYAGIKSGYIRSSHHTDTDIGTFVMDAMGVRWFCDLGSEDYSILNNSASGYWDWTEGANRWKHYRKRTEGQNTLVINPSTAAGQDTTAKCQISDYQSLTDGGYAVIDMTDAYDIYGASSAKRGMLLFDRRSRVLLQDEIVCNSPSTVYWFAHTQANISISADGKTATLTRNGKTLLAQIASPSTATFSTMTATPLTALNPNPNGQKSNSAYRKLVVKLTNVKSTRISIVFTPVTSTSDGTKTLPTIGISQFSSYLQTASAGSALPMNTKGEYEISTAEQFIQFASMVNSGTSFSGKTVKLMKDLDLQGLTLPPIGGGTDDGTSGKAFSGIFDGGNHVIRNLFLYRPNHYYVALFGSISGATIKNLGVESGRVFGYDKASGLVGISMNSTVSNCYSKASVNGTGPYHAGLIAQIVLETNVRNCYFSGSVNGTETVGGLVGYVGSNSTLNMSSCYHAGLLTGSPKYTGMIGYYHTSGSMSAIKISVSKCYSTQRLKGTQVAANTAVESYSACGTITEAQMVSAAIYIGDPFMYDCEWENDGYPVLSWQCNTTLPQNGILSSASQLRLIAWQVNSGKNTFSGKTFSLSGNLDLEGREWVPIGGNTTSAANSGYAFDGTFDGKGHSIRNLRISVGNCYVGFFGRLTGRLCNLGIKNGTVKGKQGVAGLSGCGGNIDRCYNGASIQGTAIVGGVVGTSTNSPTTNCYNTGSVTASGDYAGGIVAFYSNAANGAQLKNCYNIGKISAGTGVGAIIGIVNNSVSTLTIANCHSSSGNPLIGGNGSQFLSDCSLMSAAQLQGAASKLGSAYVADEAGRNLGYPLLAWQNDSLSDSKSLYFDFRNDTTAMAKYSGVSYGGYNFDLAEHWVTENSGSGNGDTLIKIDSAKGEMHVNLSLRDGTNGSNNTTSFEPVGSDKRFGWTGQADRANELRYAPQHAEILQVRLKLSGAEQLGSYLPRLNIYYLPKGASAWSSSADPSVKECFALMIPTTYLKGGSTEGQYVTLTASLEGSKFVSYEEIRGLHFQFSQLHGGTATLDYIYIGPAQSDALLFDFEESAKAADRYENVSYGAYNYDLPGRWSQAYTSAPTIDKGNLLLPLTKDSAKSQTILEPSNMTANFGWSSDPHTANVLNYHPSKAEVIQIRLKCNAAIPQSGKQPGLWLYYLAGNATRWSMASGTEQEGIFLKIPPEYLRGGTLEGQYLTLSASLDGTKFRRAESIKGLMLTFMSLYEGSISMDYIYIGPRSGAPTPLYTVVYKGDGGQVLATQMVHKGETATYSGTTPTKGYDASNHYAFKGWDKAQTNITADTTINALFTPTAHSYSYSKVDNTNHKGVCSCGYTVTSSHSWNGGSITTQPTCTAVGIKTYTCSVCRGTKTETVAVLGHSYTGKVTAPTCTAQGYTTYTCSRCSHTYKDNYVNAKGHTEVIDKAVAATCTTSGKTEGKHCSVCNVVLVKQETVAALGHSHTEKVTAPTCTAQGYTTYTCSRCSHTYKDNYVNAKGHAEVIDKAVAATCTTSGKTEGKHCSVCNTVLVKQETVEALGHSYTEKVTAPTCTAQGYTTYTCSRCSHTYKDNYVIAKGHAEVIDKAVAATCTTSGKTEGKHCSVCNTVLIKQETVAALDHSYITKVTVPTCTAQGYTTYTCSRCSYAYKDNYVNAKGHTEIIDKAVAATCTTSGKTEGKHCSVCNVVLVAQQTIPATGHTEVIDKAIPATCTADGLTEGRHCETCGEVLLAQETVPATGHRDTTPADNRCDICGERIKEAVLRFRTISLKGNIAINYYMDLSDEVAKDENAYMLFTMEDGEQIKVPASEGEYSLYQKAYYYSFSCAVSAKEMTDTVICQFFWDGGQTEAYTYSVKTYADRILASNSSAKLRDLIYAMLNYGAASQIHFEYHTERLANSGQEIPDYTQIAIEGFPVNTKQGTTLATYAGASLLLTSETTLRIFFTVDSSVADQFTVTYKGEVLPLGIRSGKYYADIPDISAKDLDEYFTLTISDGTETAEVSYAPLSYCASIIENAKGIHDRELQDVAAAMYLYNEAANTYFTK